MPRHWGIEAVNTVLWSGSCMMKSTYAYAIVDHRGTLAVLSGQCHIYWLRRVAQAECNKLTFTARNDHAFRVIKVVIGDAQLKVFTPTARHTSIERVNRVG
jgi:hypothetical protein